MKRILSMILALCMVMAASVALAEPVATPLMELPNGTTVVITLAEDVNIYSGTDADSDFGFWVIDDSVHAPVTLSIAPSEIEGELSLGDLTEEQQLQYGATVGEMFDNPEIHVDTTPSGNQYIHVSSNEESDITSIFTIYKGYFVELIQFSLEDFSQMTEADEAFCLSILHGIEFVNAE